MKESEIKGKVKGSRLDWEFMHLSCCNSSFQLPLLLVAQLVGVQMGFLRWLSLVGRFQIPQCVQFWWRESNSRLFFQILLVLVWSNLLFGAFLVFINSVLNRSLCLTNVADAAFIAYFCTLHLRGWWLGSCPFRCLRTDINDIRRIEERTNVNAL